MGGAVEVAVKTALHAVRLLADFRFIDRLPGRKLLVKGNHDYWWTTAAKMRRFFADNGITTIDTLILFSSVQ